LLEVREVVPEDQAPSPSLAAFNKSFGTSHRGELLSVGFKITSVGGQTSKILTLWKSPVLVDETGGEGSEQPEGAARDSEKGLRTTPKTTTSSQGKVSSSSTKKVTMQNLSKQGSFLFIAFRVFQILEFLVYDLFMKFFRIQEPSSFLPSVETGAFSRGLCPEIFYAWEVAVERLVDQEKANKQLSQESKELKCSFALAQSANLDLEKKVAELAEALKVCQDEKKVAEAALEQSKKELEKVQKTHEDDLSLIEHLRGKHDRASKVAEDLHVNNANLAKSLSTKDRRILDLEKALAEQDDASKKNMSDILEKLKLLFEEYKKSLNEFGVRPAPLPADIGVPEFMDSMETEFKALSEVISGASDFAAAFSVESILKILHDFDCADLEKFREKISQFPSTMSTSIIRANEDVQAIKNKFAREFWFASEKETFKIIARAKLAEVNFRTISSPKPVRDVLFLEFPLHWFVHPFQLNEEENHENVTASPEESTSDGDSSDSGEEGSSSSSSGNSDEDSNDSQASGRDESSPKVDVTD
jgi:hypothetical protein